MEPGVLFRRLRAMSAAEIFHRLHRLAVDRLSARRALRTADDIDPSCLESLARLGLTANVRKEDWHSAGLDIPVLERAEALLRGEWTLFGRKLALGAIPDWQADPFTGSEPGADSPAPGLPHSQGLDIRSIWELNRLQELVTLGQAYRLSGESRYSGRAAKLIDNWSSTNPYLESLNWVNTLEAALRAISLLQTAALCRESEHFHETSFRGRLAGLLFLHGHFIRAHLSRGSTALNHLAGEAAGLTVLGYCLPALPGSSGWRRAGAAKLEESLMRLILEDGGPLEGSLHYLAFTACLAATAWQLAGPFGFSLSVQARERLKNAYRFLCAATDNGRAVSEFGDSDCAAAAGPPAGSNPERYSRALNMLRLINEEEHPAHDYRPDPESACLFGAPALCTGTAAVNENGLCLERFDKSGHYILRAPGFFLRFECGHWGASPCHAHAHADRLSFSLFLGGLPFLIDPGTGAYLADSQLREHLRSTRAHNTLCLDGLSQAQPVGCFFQPRPVESTLVDASIHDKNGAVLEGEVAALPEPNGPLHRRRISLDLDARSLTIEDEITRIGQNSRYVEIDFVFHPDCDTKIKKGKKTRLAAHNGGRRLEITADPLCLVSLHRGEHEPRRGWFSRSFMQAEPCWQACLSALIQKETKFVTVIRW